MPIIKQSRVIRQYGTSKADATANDFLAAVRAALDCGILQPRIHANVNLQFEETMIQGDIQEVEQSLSQVPSDEPPLAFFASAVTNTNPQRHFIFQVSPLQKAVNIQLLNLTKTEAQPVLKAIAAVLPEGAPLSKVDEPSQRPAAEHASGIEDVYLPGPFRPQRMPKLSDKDVFVIMAFQREHRDAYNLAIKPTLESLGFRPIRIDDVQHNANGDTRDHSAYRAFSVCCGRFDA